MEEKEKYSILPDWATTKNKERTTLEGEISLIGANALSVFNAIMDYVEKYRTSYLPYEGLIRHIYEYGIRTNNPELKNQNSIIELFKSLYVVLVKKKFCKPELIDKKLVAIILRDPKSPLPEDIPLIRESLRKDYEKCSEEAKSPFPSVNQYGSFHFYPDTLYVISLKEYIEILFSGAKISQPFCKILLPENADIFFPVEMFPTIPKIAFSKIQMFLSYSELSNLILNKLKERFSSMKVVSNIKDIFPLEKLPFDILNSLLTEILSSINIEKDFGLWQSCQLLLGIAYKEGIDSQRKILEKDAFNLFLKVAEKTNSFFGRSALLKLRDSSPNLKVFTLENYIKIVDNFLDKYSSKDASLPLIFSENKGDKLYIHRNNFYKHLIDFIGKVSIELHKAFSEKYSKYARAFLKEPFMKNKDTFEEYVGSFVLNQNSPIVPFLKDEQNLFKILGYCERNIPEARDITKRFFLVKGEGASLRAFSEITGINYEQILKEARLFLPFFEGFNIFKWISSIFKKFGRRLDSALDAQLKARKESPKLSELIKSSVTRSVIENKASLKINRMDKKDLKQKEMIIKSLENFKKEMIGDKSAREMLNLYEEKWNHIINKKVREENLNYVKNEIAKRLKFIKTPSVENILKEAEDLIVTHKQLKEITDQKALKNYIVLVMIEYFLNKKE